MSKLYLCGLCDVSWIGQLPTHTARVCWFCGSKEYATTSDERAGWTLNRRHDWEHYLAEARRREEAAS